MKRTAIYMRVSTQNQVQEGDSIAAQRDALRKYVKEHGLILVGEYLDDGVSGTREDRDELQRLLSDVKDGKIDLILATKLDRIYRSIRHYLNFQDTLDKHGVNWLAIWEPIYDTSTPQGRLIINQMMSIAQFEAENTGQRIRQVNAYKLSQNEVVSGKVPFGYRVENKHLVPADTAPIAREAFEMYARTGNMHQTMLHMAHYEGFPHTVIAFRNLLRNTLYIGQHPNKADFCEPIIDRELFEDVQRKMGMNIKYGRKREYIFSGLLKCAHCGHSLSANEYSVRRGDKRYFAKQYRCPMHYARDAVKVCPNSKAYRERVLERYLLENIRPLIEGVALEWETKQKEVKDNSARVAALEKKITRLKELFVNDLITLDEYKADRADLEAQLAAERAQTAQEAPNAERLREFAAMDIEGLYEAMSASEKRYFWRSVIKEIKVNYDKHIEVVFLP